MQNTLKGWMADGIYTLTVTTQYTKDVDLKVSRLVSNRLCRKPRWG